MNIDKFVKAWNPEPKKSFRQRIRDVVNREPIRYKLMVVNYKIKAMVTRLEAHIARLRERDAMLFERVVEALQQGDKQRAAVYATEVAEIRKAIKQLMIVKLALEQVSLRLETVMTLGDTMAAIAPLAGIIHELKAYVRGVMPMLSLELMDLEETLNSIVVESGEFISMTSVSAAASGEARKILQEAALLAEQKLREQFPEVPSAGTLASGQEAHA
ncbi:hypothetical protein Pyrfu_1480 [Pyrolobus fumarii 1A]|uniref:Uncharacterized protein n=1 Tax=Pyrolobus fumarii (strain DSM 11204 / 1A) TaxID=694429 RepID=G0EHB4_PYRF1|nr:Snf7 family protein [Pyrolobus fumarii]AEM39338.1 hypothetical protein Pyrfu_1480 [Pyrolobus fumarii 1A]